MMLCLFNMLVRLFRIHVWRCGMKHVFYMIFQMLVCTHLGTLIYCIIYVSSILYIMFGMIYNIACLLHVQYIYCMFTITVYALYWIYSYFFCQIFSLSYISLSYISFVFHIPYCNIILILLYCIITIHYIYLDLFTSFLYVC